MSSSTPLPVPVARSSSYGGNNNYNSRRPTVLSTIVELSLTCASAVAIYYLASHLTEYMPDPHKLKPGQSNSGALSRLQKIVDKHSSKADDKADSEESSPKSKKLNLNSYELVLSEHVIDPEDIPVTFADIGGIDSSKAEIYDLVVLPLLRCVRTCVLAYLHEERSDEALRILRLLSEEWRGARRRCCMSSDDFSRHLASLRDARTAPLLQLALLFAVASLRISRLLSLLPPRLIASLLFAANAPTLLTSRVAFSSLSAGPTSSKPVTSRSPRASCCTAAPGLARRCSPRPSRGRAARASSTCSFPAS